MQVVGSGTAATVRLIMSRCVPSTTPPLEGSNVTLESLKAPNADRGLSWQPVTRKCRCRFRKVVEVSVEAHRPSRQRRKKAGCIQVDVNGMHHVIGLHTIQEGDVNLTERPEVTGVIERYLIAPGAIVEKRQGGTAPLLVKRPKVEVGSWSTVTSKSRSGAAVS
jgi:hypothetical protein